jgi:Mrp family chromosome partitioning ATPase
VSKNFELLQKIGGEDELFRTSGYVKNDIVKGDGEANPEIEREARERILQNASLPNVLETPGASEGHHGRGNHKVLWNNSVALEVQTSESSTIPLDLPASSPDRQKSNEFQKSAESFGLRGGSSTAASPMSIPNARPTRDREPRGKARREESRERSSPARWMRSVKSKVERWNRKLEVPNQLRVNDREAMAREEEVKLVERVFSGKEQESPRVALFAGLERECGSAEICARSAEILAARGDGPVCIVDANFQRPSLHQYFGVENEKGLAEATVEAGSIQNFVQQIPEPDLWLLTSGRAHTGNGFSKIADGLRVRIKELRTAFRYVVIHAGALRLETSAMLMSRWTDGVVLVVEANSTRRDSAKRAKENLQAANVSILGVVLTNRTFPIPEAIYRRL